MNNPCWFLKDGACVLNYEAGSCSSFKDNLRIEKVTDITYFREWEYNNCLICHNAIELWKEKLNFISFPMHTEFIGCWEDYSAKKVFLIKNTGESIHVGDIT